MPQDGRPSNSVWSRTNSIGTSVIVAMPYLNGMRVLSWIWWMEPPVIFNGTPES